MGNFFGKEKTAEEELDDIKIDLEVTIDNIGYAKEELLEKCGEYKAKAKEQSTDGKEDTCLQTLRHIVRLTKICNKMDDSIMKIENMKNTITLVNMQAKMQETMANVCQLLGVINESMSGEELQEIMSNFEQQQKELDAKQIILDSKMEQSMKTYDDPEEEKRLLEQLKREIGIEMNLPEVNIDENDITKRIEQLNKDI